MKQLLLCAPILLLAGCSSIVPKDVEFFQDKVKPLPIYERNDKELLKQALLLSAQAYDRIAMDNQAVRDQLKGIMDDADGILLESLEIATQDPAYPLPGEVVKEKAVGISGKADVIKERATTATAKSDFIAQDAKGGGKVTDAASKMVGSPKKEFEGEPKELADDIRKSEATLDEKLSKYAEDISDNIGKKIEGSGMVQMGYFNFIMVIAVLGFSFIMVLKVIAANNPAISAGTRIIKAGGSVVSAAATQTFEAIDDFKSRVRKAKLPPEVQDEIRDLLRRSLEAKQDTKSKELVAKVRGKKNY